MAKYFAYRPDDFEPSAHAFISGGPDRVNQGKENMNFKHRPVGFVLPEIPDEKEPDLWEGDDN